MAIKDESESEWRKEDTKEKVTFKVVEVNNGEKIVWGPGVETKEGWSNWSIRFGDREDVKLNVPQGSGTYNLLNYQAIGCQERKIEKALEGAGQEVTVSAIRGGENTGGLNVEVDSGSCTDTESGKKEECEIKFLSGVNLRWVSDFKPKAIFPKSSKK